MKRFAAFSARRYFHAQTRDVDQDTGVSRRLGHEGQAGDEEEEEKEGGERGREKTRSFFAWKEVCEKTLQTYHLTQARLCTAAAQLCDVS